MTAAFPLGCLTCVTGVSGSGKSTLVDDILRRALFRHFYRSKDRPGKHAALHGLEQIDKAIVIDQTPIGRTPRSNPATYTGAFGPIRDLFAGLPASRIRGYDSGRFSFNVKGGRCEIVRGRRDEEDRDALPRRRLCRVRGLPRPALQSRDARDHLQGQEHRRCARHDRG